MPSRRARLAVALVAAVVAVGVASVIAPWRGVADFLYWWRAALAVRAGVNPYAASGLPDPFYYPLPAALATLPLTPLPLPAAFLAFVGLGTGLLAYGLTRDGYARLPMLASACALWGWREGQWSPLLAAAATLPALGWVYACKPNIAAALWLGWPSRRALAMAVGFAGLSLAVAPGWPAAWLATLHRGPQYLAPVQEFGGVVLLLAALRWRRPEGRLLLGLACVPQAPVLYEALPVFLVARTLRESLTLAILSHVAALAVAELQPYATRDEFFATTRALRTALLYLPALLMLLRRPNEGALPAWWPARLTPTSTSGTLPSP